MKHFALPYRTQLLLVCSALVVGTAVTMTIPLYTEARARAIGVYRERLMAVAHGTSVALDPDTVELLRATPVGKTIPYIVVRQTLREFAWRAGDSTHVSPEDGLLLIARDGPAWRMIAHSDWSLTGERPTTRWPAPRGLEDSLGNLQAGRASLWWFAEKERLVAVSPVFAGTVPVGLAVASVPRSVVDSELRSSLRRIIWFPIVALVLAIAIAAWLARQLTGRVERLAQQAGVLATGDLRHAVIDETRDEFGVLARALHELSSRLRSVLHDVHASADAVYVAVGHLTTGSEEIHSQNLQVASAAQAIAESVTAQTNDIRAISVLAAAAAEVADDVRSSATAADGTAEHITLAARRVAEEVDDALQRMTTISRVTADAIPAVEQLERKSRRITSVASVIAQLADQASLLSINAAIEAARAGAHGRGFSVVAAEVRALSDATSTALDDIRAIATDIEQVSRQTGDRMSEMQRSVLEGEAVIQSSAQAVQQILASVEAGRSATSVIVGYADSQHDRVSRVSKHVDTIADVAADNASTVQQVSAAVEAQGDVARTLADSSARLGAVVSQLRSALVGFQF
jgi:methyl-accepting chemotaxis protein